MHCFKVQDHAHVHGTHQGRSQRGLLCRQQTDCVRLQRQNYQALEHSWSLQIHHPGRYSFIFSQSLVCDFCENYTVVLH